MLRALHSAARSPPSERSSERPQTRADCTDDGLCQVQRFGLRALPVLSVDQNAIVHGGVPKDGFELLVMVTNSDTAPGNIAFRERIAR